MQSFEQQSFGYQPQGFGQTQGFGQNDYGYGYQPQAALMQQSSGSPRRMDAGPDLTTRVKKFIMTQPWVQSLPQGAVKSILEVSQADIMTYCAGVAMIISGYLFLSNGGAGQVVPLAAAIQLMGFCMAYLRAKTSNCIAGISPQTLHVWLAGILCRLSVNVIIFWSDHADSYLPSDGTCDWAYQILELGSAGVIMALLYEIHVVHRVAIESCKMSPMLIAGGLAMSVLIHPKLNNCWSNLRFAAGQYLEGVAMIPQIMEMAKSNGKVEALTSHYIACSFVASVLMFSWWWGVQSILATDEYPSMIPARMILLSSASSVLLLGDFMYQYVKAALKNAAIMFTPGFDV